MREGRRTARLGLPIGVVVLVAACFTSAIGVASADSSRPGAARPPVVALVTCQHTDRLPTQEINTAKLYIEYNSTDDDIGVHGAFDDAGWKRLCVFDPTGRQLLAVNPLAQLGDLTMGAIFFLSLIHI